MKISVDKLGFKRYCQFSDRELAKAYVVYALNCSRELTDEEWITLTHSVLKFTLRNNRVFVSRIWKQNNVIYFLGKQSHRCGYSWDYDVLNAFYPIFNQFLDQHRKGGSANSTPQYRKMKYFYRKILVREPINHFGKLGFKMHVQLVKVKNEIAIIPFNKGKRIHFTETTSKEYLRILRHNPIGQVYDFTLD